MGAQFDREMLKAAIRDLDWYDARFIRVQVAELIVKCEKTGQSMWVLVEEVGGLFAIEMLIHALCKGVAKCNFESGSGPGSSTPLAGPDVRHLGPPGRLGRRPRFEHHHSPALAGDREMET